MLAAACSPRPSRPPNILLVTLDTTRADHLGAYGFARARTPHLDRLASAGVLFERTIAAAPITLPAHVTLLTGLYPFVHGVRTNGAFGLDDRIPTLATALRAAGYRTGAFVSAFVLDRRFGLARGFDRYDDAVERSASRGGEVERRGDRTAAAAVDWIRSSAPDAAPFFAWVHLYDPHDPYDPPAPFRDAFADAPYDGEIAFDDDVVGRLVDAVGTVADPSTTIIAVVGDHGESLGEHGEATHALFVYESALRVPLIVTWPGHLPAGRRVAPLVRAIDVAPTLLALAGQPPLHGARGRNLAALMAGTSRAGGETTAAGANEAYAETFFPLFSMNWSPLRSIQDGRWKFIEAPGVELYDLSTDPGERTNLADREPARAAALARALAALTGGGPGSMATRRIDRETADKLSSLGYIGQASTSDPQSDRQSDRKSDPKAMVGVFDQVRAANAAVRAGRAADGERLARAALARDRDNAFATFVLAEAELDQGRSREALAGFRRYAQLVPASADAHHRIAVCLSRMDAVDDALREEEAAIAIDPRDAEAHVLRGGLLARQGHVDEAARALRTATEIEPSNAPFRVGLARVLIAAGRHDEAEREVRRALDLNPSQADAHAAWAALMAARGQLAGAAEEYRRALTLRPDYDDVRLDYAATLDRMGASAAAEAEYRRLASNAATPPPVRDAARRRLRLQ